MDLKTVVRSIPDYPKPGILFRDVTTLFQDAEALKQLTDELFKYSVVTSAEEKLKFERISLNSALEESIAEYYVALQKRSITPEIIITDKKIERTLDKTALSRILSNNLEISIKIT